MRKGLFSFLFILFAPLGVQAGWAFDLSGSATMGHFSSESMADNSIYMYEFVGGYADKTNGIAFGFAYTGLAGTAWATAGTSYFAGSLVGVKVFYSHPKAKWIGMAMSYYPGATLTEESPTQTTSRLGSATEFEAGFYLALKGNWQASLKLCYYSLSMSTSKTGSVTSTTPYSRTLVLPTASIRYGF